MEMIIAEPPAYLAPATLLNGSGVLSSADTLLSRTNSKASRLPPEKAEIRSSARIASSSRARSLRSSAIIGLTFIVFSLCSKCGKREFFYSSFQQQSVRQQGPDNILNLGSTFVYGVAT